MIEVEGYLQMYHTLLSTSPSSPKADQEDLLIEIKTAKSSLLVWEGLTRSAKRQSKGGGVLES